MLLTAPYSVKIFIIVLLLQSRVLARVYPQAQGDGVDKFHFMTDKFI